MVSETVTSATITLRCKITPQLDQEILHPTGLPSSWFSYQLFFPQQYLKQCGSVLLFRQSLYNFIFLQITKKNILTSTDRTILPSLSRQFWFMILYYEIILKVFIILTTIATFTVTTLLPRNFQSPASRLPSSSLVISMFFEVSKKISIHEQDKSLQYAAWPKKDLIKMLLILMSKSIYAVLRISPLESFWPLLMVLR